VSSYVFQDGTGWVQLASGNLPNSGVTAATYGDATHVGAFTVSAKGVITSASNVAITASGGSVTIASAEVLTDQSTSSTTYTDLGTVGPAATVTVGASGIVLIGWNVGFGTGNGLTSVAVSGATTIAASESYALGSGGVSGGLQLGRTYVFTGLTAGSTTFTVQYRASTGTADFFRRSLWAIAQ
jgi:hypothetical protein